MKDTARDQSYLYKKTSIYTSKFLTRNLEFSTFLKEGKKKKRLRPSQLQKFPQAAAFHVQ